MEKNINYYMKLPYKIMVTVDKDNNDNDHYYARVLEFPCLGDGNTHQEAFECLREHMKISFEACLKDGIPIIEPQTKYSGNIFIRVDPALHADLAQEASACDMSLNRYVSLILERRRAIEVPAITKKKVILSK